MDISKALSYILENPRNLNESILRSLLSEAKEEIPLDKKEKLEEKALYFANQLTTFTSDVETVGQAAFLFQRELKSVNLPKVTAIGDQVFQDHPKLESITLPNTVVCTLGNHNSFLTTCKIYVPANLLDQYKAAPNWSTYAAQIFAIPELVPEPEPTV